MTNLLQEVADFKSKMYRAETNFRAAESNFNDALNQVWYLLGRMHATVEIIHTCNQAHYRHPWPLDRRCRACRHELLEHVVRTHSEMAYLLFGWDAMIESLERAIKVKLSQREANLMKGAYI